MAAKSRYTLLLTENTEKQLAELQVRYGKENRADVFDLALTLLAWAAKEKQRGNLVGSYNEGRDTFRELLLPFVEAAQTPVAESPVANAEAATETGG